MPSQKHSGVRPPTPALIATTPAFDRPYTPPSPFSGPPSPPKEEDIPFAPPPSCPEGERLYKVKGTAGTQYIYADPGASKEEIQEMAGGPGFVTSVMSPEAYSGDQLYKKVTTADGREIQVPWDPEKEAKGEYAKIYGEYPTKAVLAGEGEEGLAGIASAIRSGGWTPVLELPVVKDVAVGAGIPPLSALSEIKRAEDVTWGAVTGGIPSCGPFGLALGETELAKQWFLQTGQPERAEKLTEFYAAAYGRTGFVERAEEVGHDIFDDLAPYRKGQEYDLSKALAAGVVTEAQLLKWFPASAVSLAASQTAAVGAVSAIGVIGSGEHTIEGLGQRLAAGEITAGQLALVFTPETVEYVQEYAGTLPSRPLSGALHGFPIRRAPMLSTQTTLSGPLVGAQWITPWDLKSLEGVLGREPTRSEFVGAFTTTPGGVPLPWVDTQLSNLYGKLYPQYTGPSYAALEVAMAPFPATKAWYPQVGVGEVRPSEWAWTGVNIALLGYGIRTGVSALRAPKTDLVTVEYGVVGRAGHPVTYQTQHGIAARIFGRVTPGMRSRGTMAGGPTVEMPIGWDVGGTYLPKVSPIHGTVPLSTRLPVVFGEMVEMGRSGVVVLPPSSPLVVSPSPGGISAPISWGLLETTLARTYYHPEAPGLTSVFGGGVRTITPITPLVGSPGIYTPSIATMTQTGVAGRLASLGVLPVVSVVSPFVAPRVTPLPIVTPTPTPTPALVPRATVVAVATTLATALTAPFPQPTPVHTPAPSPVLTPAGTPTVTFPGTTLPPGPQYRQPIRVPLPGFGAPTFMASKPKKKRKRGRLLGTRWLMPGLMIHFPDPFGVGKLSYRLAKPRARKYGARVPKPSIGGVRI